MKNIKSLSYRTDLIFVRFLGNVIENDGFILAEIPSSPGFYWGNFLLFPKPPKPEDCMRWPEIFRKAFAHRPRVKHMAMGWDDPRGEFGAANLFAQNGFTLMKNVVLTASKLSKPAKFNPRLEVRPLQTDEEWQQATRNQIQSRDPQFSEESYTAFKIDQMANYRGMVQAQLGFWYGAFSEGNLVADLGIFIDAQKTVSSNKVVARFQMVGTHPDFRRQGACSTLVYLAAEHCQRLFGVETFVMVADPEYHAVKVYEGVGFKATEHAAGMWLNSKADLKT